MPVLGLGLVSRTKNVFFGQARRDEHPVRDKTIHALEADHGINWGVTSSINNLEIRRRM